MRVCDGTSFCSVSNSAARRDCPCAYPALRYSRPVKAVYRFLTSPRLALVLILVIAGLSVIATLVPQGYPEQWYVDRYPAFILALVRTFHLDSFFTSAVFLAPVGLFTVNLAGCATDRLVGRLRRRALPRFGPDLVHAGLLVLIAAGLATALGRREVALTLSAGETAALDPSRTIQIVSLASRVYDDGTPAEWTSTVLVLHDGREEVRAFPIEVNHPLRLPGMSVYQADWGADGTLRLADRAGGTVTPRVGDWLEQGDSRWVYARLEKAGEEWTAVFARVRADRLLETRTLRPGDVIGPFTVRGIEAREVTGLRAVRDPGVAPFLVGLVLVAAGLVVTLAQRRREAGR